MKNNRILTILILVVTMLLFLCSGNLNASEAIILSNKNLNGTLIGKYLEYYEDRQRELTIEDLLSKDKSFEFIKSNVEIPTFGYSSSVYWLRFKTFNPTKRFMKWCLEYSYTTINNVELYKVKENRSYVVKKLSIMDKGAQKIKSVNLIFFTVDRPGINTYYVKIDNFIANIPLKMWSLINIFNAINTNSVILFMFFGIMIIMTVYNLIIFFYTKDSSYLWYSIHTFSLTLQFVLLSGFGWIYLWYGHHFFEEMGMTVVIFSALSALVFSRKYLQTKIYTPKIDKFLLLPFLGLLALVDITNYGAGKIILQKSRLLMLSFQYFLSGLVIIAIFIAFFIGLFYSIKRIRTGYFYLIGYTSMLVGALLYTLKEFGILPQNYVTQHAVLLGCVLMVVLFSLGLGDRMSMMNRELDDLNRNLEAKVMERTEELAVANKELEAIYENLIEKSHALEESYDRLKDLDRLKSNFVANISHEIRTPLTLILSPVEALLLKDTGAQPDENFFKNILRNGMRLLKLINNLLDLSKIDAGQMKMTVREINIASFIKKYSDIVKPTADSKKIEIRNDSIKNDLNIFADLEKLDKIMMNLLSNAIKFTDENGKIILRSYESGNACIIEIEDTGEGIPKDDIPNVFDRFIQSESGSARKNYGTGIGLSLVKELVLMHGGTIEIESRYIAYHPEDHGTVFRINFQLGMEHFKERNDIRVISDSYMEDSVAKINENTYTDPMALFELREDENGNSVSVSSDIQFERLDILVVEDNTDMQHFLDGLLSEQYIVHMSGDGLDGLAKAKSIKPQCIVTDVMMPQMDGFEMTRRLKRDDSLKNIPVIMLTARPDISKKIEGLEYGADDYLIKPFNPAELLTRVKGLINLYQYKRIISERNREIETHLMTCRTIIMKMMPLGLKHTDHVSINSLYIPCDRIGGDFFDYLIADDRIDLCIADVAGHGTAAAFFGLIIRTHVSGLLRQRADLVDIMNEVNDLVYRNAPDSYFITMFLCRYFPGNGSIEFMRAGHYYPFVVRSGSNEISNLKTSGPPLGCQSAGSWIKGIDRIGSGDRLIFFTDGIIETRNQQEDMFNDIGLADFLKDHAESPIESFTNELVNCLKEFSGRAWFEDDISLIVFDVRT